MAKMPRTRTLLFLLLAIAFAIRLAAGWAWELRLDERRFGMGDSESYWTLACQIAQNQPYEYTSLQARVFRTPGYPLLLAPILYFVGDNQTAILLARAQAALLSTLAVAAVYWLTRLLFDDRAALLAAFFATFYPGAIALSALILSDGPFCPVMLLQIVLCVLAYRAQTSTRIASFAFCAGLAAGAATLIRPSWLLFTPFAVVAELAMTAINRHHVEPSETRRASPPATQNNPTSYRHLQMAACMLLGLVVAMLPWWIRNAYVTGHFVPTTLQVGASLYDGLNPDATGASNMDFVGRFVEQEERAPTSHDSLELRLDRRMRTEAIDWAKTNPGHALQLAAVKFLRMWNVWPNEPRLNAWPIRLAVLFTYTPLLICAIIGVWRTLDRGWPYLLCWLPAVYLTLLHVVFVSSIRYREPAMLALLALAAGAGMRGKKDKR